MPTTLPTRGVLRDVLWQAVRRLYLHDTVLIADRTHERSMVFHIGRYVAAEVDKWPGNWRVDVEYNRYHQTDFDALSKYLPATSGRLAGFVYPDLIIHDRSESSKSTNLLVLEVKNTPDVRDRKVDYGKLRGYSEVLRYGHAVFLELRPPPDAPRWLWVNDPTMAAYQDPRLPPPPMW